MKTILFAGKPFHINHKKQQFEAVAADQLPIWFSLFAPGKDGFFYIHLHRQKHYPVDETHPDAVQINVFAETFFDSTRLEFLGK